MTSFQTFAFLINVILPTILNSENHASKYLNSNCYSSIHLKSKWRIRILALSFQTY